MTAVDVLVERATPAFFADAACRHPHPDADWFPERGGSAGRARDVCARCPVRRDCLAWALDQGPWLQGIFGGLTQHQRRRIALHHEVVVAA